ncbi:MAG: metallophosphoesterase, partial [Nocardioides sp.]|nr:metallophosphoesterase [Nocardioides sp.]
MSKKRVLRILGCVVAWLIIAVPTAVGLFLNSHTSVNVASHDTVISPTLDGYATVRTGPFLPDVRRSTDSRIGVNIVLGKTEAASTEELVQRYAFIASQPDAQIERVEDAVRHMAVNAGVRGALIGAIPVLIWVGIGRERRRSLARFHDPKRSLTTVGVGATVIGLLVLVVVAPWADDEELLVSDDNWQSLESYIPEISIPDEAKGIQVEGTLAASGTKRLVFSAIDTYDKSRTFYAAAAEQAKDLELRQPGEDESMAVMVSDRHDNIGMDPVARAVADQVGATAVLNGGDDTSTGAAWEAFSLDSLDDAFSDYDQRFTVQGNHDNGGFVQRHLADLGWTTATTEVVEGPDDGRFLSWNDPRSSGLGNWRDEHGLTIEQTADRIADVACASEERVNTLLVHDSDMGTASLKRGCVDLVLSGHVHVQVGPDLVRSRDGEDVGYTYTNGTTGGAAYALAVGSKLRRA